MNIRNPWSYSLVTAAIMSIVAMGSNVTDNKEETYSRLLSEEYMKIAQLEYEKGTYSHKIYFRDQASKSKNINRPRPSTVGKFKNAKRYRKKINEIRSNLERAIVGYEMRNAPKEVAKMHASYECILRNIGVNRRISKICMNSFESSYKKAKEATSQNNTFDIDITPVSDEEIHDFESHSFDTTPINENIEPEDIIVKSHSVDKEEKYQREKSTEEIYPFQRIEVIEQKEDGKTILDYKSGDNVNHIKNEIVEKDLSTLPLPSEQIEGVEKEFDPLDYVHPRLRAKQRSIQKSQDISSDTPTVNEKNDFGIKQIGKVKVSNQPSINELDKSSDIAISSPHITNSIISHKIFGSSPSNMNLSMFSDRMNKETKIHNRFISSAKYDPISTASIDEAKIQSSTDKLVVSFVGGGTQLSTSAIKTINEAKAKIAKGNYKNISITGHADTGGSKKINDKISLKRAYAVLSKLQKTLNSKNISDISVGSLGDRKPILSLKPTDNRNRRVVIELTRGK